jgi:hypothetical protein
MGRKFLEYSGQIITYTLGENNHRIRCCDCGLVHDIHVVVTQNPAVARMELRRNNRSTGQTRRWRGIKVKYREL